MIDAAKKQVLAAKEEKITLLFQHVEREREREERERERRERERGDEREREMREERERERENSKSETLFFQRPLFRFSQKN